MTTATENATAVIAEMTERLTGLQQTLTSERAERQRVRDLLGRTAQEAYDEYGYDALVELCAEFDLPTLMGEATAYRLVACVQQLQPGSTALGFSSTEVRLPYGVSMAVTVMTQSANVRVPLDDEESACACAGAEFPEPDHPNVVGFIDFGRYCYSPSCVNTETRERVSVMPGSEYPTLLGNFTPRVDRLDT